MDCHYIQWSLEQDRLPPVYPRNMLYLLCHINYHRLLYEYQNLLFLQDSSDHIWPNLCTISVSLYHLLNRILPPEGLHVFSLYAIKHQILPQIYCIHREQIATYHYYHRYLILLQAYQQRLSLYLLMTGHLQQSLFGYPLHVSPYHLPILLHRHFQVLVDILTYLSLIFI